MHRLAKLRLLCLLCSLILSTRPAYAQGDASPPPGLEPVIHFTHLTADDGLAQNNIEAIVQDRQGFIWIGTPAGLSRYDGYRFTTYKHDPDNPNSLSHNHVRDLFEDRDGLIWIATEGGGVNKFDPRTETFSRYLPDRQNPNSLGGDRIFSIFQDSAGNFWFGGTTLSGLTRFNPTTQTFTRYRRNLDDPNAFHGDGVWDMLEDEQGQLWLTGDYVLVKYDLRAERFTHYTPPVPEEGRLAALHRDAAGNLWVGGERGLYKFDPQSGVFSHYPALRQVNDLLADETGMLWVATLNGLHRFDLQTGQVTRHYRHDATQVDSLSNDRVTRLYQDRAGLLWIGTGEGGLNLYDPGQARFSHYRHDPNTPASLAGGTVNAIYVADERHLWLGVGSVLDRVDLASGRVTHYTPETPAGAATTINAVYQDRAGFVWLGLSNFRLVRFDPGSGQFTDYPLISQAPAGPIGPPKDIVALYEDRQGALWLGVDHEGLYRLDPQRQDVRYYETPRALGTPKDVPLNNVPRPPISNLYGDRAGNIWVSTWNGFSRFDPATGVFHQYRARAGRPGPDSWIEAFLEDRHGRLWLATRDGLVHFDPRTETVIKTYTEKDGLPTAYIVGLLEDQAGNLWLSTKKGLSRFTPAGESFRNYDRADGLQGNEFSARAFGQTEAGWMFFGGANGLTAFDPAQVQDNPYRPPLVLTDFQLFNKAVQPGQDSLLARPIWATEQLTLNYDQNILTFEFAALSYGASHKNRYRYQLEGFETGWNEVDSGRRFATYTNLPAGDYLLRVQGSNNDGLWSNQEVALKVTVHPPWWLTTWFWLAASSVVAGLVFGVHRWRVSAIKRRNRQLEAQVAERTRALSERGEQLAQSNRELAVAKEKAEAANQAKSAFLTNMSHELRSPLNAIIGFAQVIARSQSLSPEHRENVSIIRRSGEHLLALINQVLDLSKIEAGRMPLNPTDFDLRRLLDDLRDMFALKAEEKRLQLRLEWDAGAPQYIRADETKLRQVLINLLNNALKFTEAGEVRVGVRTDEASETVNGASGHAIHHPSPITLHFEVEDTGPGIAPEELEKLFEAFSQTETGRQAQEGAGLGLSISRKFIQLMGGDIAVKSQVGQGSVFIFQIQCQRLASIQNPKSKIQNRIIGLAPGQPRYRILIVDDNWINRRLLLKLLDRLGFALREAEHGQQAVEIWQAWQPHLIWMDMRMPVMDGYEATQRIKATAQGQATAIIALTASSLEEDKALVLATGCDDFVRKPFHESDIFEMMTRHIGVQFVYEAPAVQPADDECGPANLEPDLSALPPELSARLKEVVEFSDMEGIENVITELRQRDANLAGALAKLAGAFAYDQILAQLEEP
jgi:signal transduction histidine kinase/ligand-binding sensor domain-containing protein/CheY-like chemotaxis protein